MLNSSSPRSLETVGQFFAAIRRVRHALQSKALCGAMLLATGCFGASLAQAQSAQFLPIVNPVASITSANLTDVISDRYGNFFVTDMTNNVIRRIDAVTGAITTVAGGGAGTCTSGAKDTLGDGCLATQAILKNPYGVRFYKGDMYIADAGDSYIRVVNGVTGIITVYAGTGKIGAPTAGAAATASNFQTPQSIVFDAAGDLFIYAVNQVYVTRIDAVTKTVAIVGGIGTVGTTGDGGPALQASLAAAAGMAIDAQGNLYLGNQAGCGIRKITIPLGATTGTISTYAGTGTCGFFGRWRSSDVSTNQRAVSPGFRCSGRLVFYGLEEQPCA